MLHCTKCSAELPEGVRSCPSCGKAIEPPEKQLSAPPTQRRIEVLREEIAEARHRKMLFIGGGILGYLIAVGAALLAIYRVGAYLVIFLFGISVILILLSTIAANRSELEEGKLMKQLKELG
jgi:predicted nucleic acid-binding Zn ribbon protein